MRRKMIEVTSECSFDHVTLNFFAKFLLEGVRGTSFHCWSEVYIEFRLVVTLGLLG